MKQFTLPLIEGRQRPTIRLTNFFQLNAMLDTGAVLPVWVEEEEFLEEIGGIPIAQNLPFGGFGGMTTGTLYRLPLFRCGDLLFPEFPIIASRSALSCQMLLSATMFNGLVYEIDDWHHKFNLTIPDHESHVRKLAIENKDGKLHIFCTGKDMS